MEIICCVCNKRKEGNGWVVAIRDQRRPRSHGYCPDCYHETLKKIQLRFTPDREVSAA